MTRPPPLAAALALPLLPTTAGCLSSLAPPDAPTFPPVAAGEAVVGLSLDAVAVAVGLLPLPPGQRLESRRRQHRRCWLGYIGSGPYVPASWDFTAAIQV
jgi:hypothetical protein